MIAQTQYDEYNNTTTTTTTAEPTERRPRSLSDASTGSENEGLSKSSLRRGSKFTTTTSFDNLYKIQDCQQVSDLYRECVANKFSDRKVCSTATSLYVACSYSDK